MGIFCTLQNEDNWFRYAIDDLPVFAARGSEPTHKIAVNSAVFIYFSLPCFLISLSPSVQTSCAYVGNFLQILCSFWSMLSITKDQSLSSFCHISCQISLAHYCSLIRQIL